MKIIFFRVWITFIMLYSCMLNAASNEFVAEIIDLDIKKGETILLYMHMEKIDFRLAFDVRIQLANGEKGAVANLRKGNQITAVGDTDKKVIYVINVLN